MSSVWVASFLALWVVVLVMAFLLVGALREIGLLHLRLRDPGALISEAGLDRGVVGPDFQAVDATSGSVVSLYDLPSADRALLFVSPGCISCHTLAAHIKQVSSARPEFDYVIVCSGQMQECRDFLTEADLGVRTLIDETGAAEQLYEIVGTPFGYLLDKRGRVLIRGVVNDAAQLESLLDQEGSLEPPQPSKGEVLAPAAVPTQ